MTQPRPRALHCREIGVEEDREPLLPPVQASQETQEPAVSEEKVATLNDKAEGTGARDADPPRARSRLRRCKTTTGILQPPDLISDFAMDYYDMPSPRDEPNVKPPWPPNMARQQRDSSRAAFDYPAEPRGPSSRSATGGSIRREADGNTNSSISGKGQGGSLRPTSRHSLPRQPSFRDKFPSSLKPSSLSRSRSPSPNQSKLHRRASFAPSVSGKDGSLPSQARIPTRRSTSVMEPPQPKPISRAPTSKSTPGELPHQVADNVDYGRAPSSAGSISSSPSPSPMRSMQRRASFAQQLVQDSAPPRLRVPTSRSTPGEPVPFHEAADDAVYPPPSRQEQETPSLSVASNQPEADDELGIVAAENALKAHYSLLLRVQQHGSTARAKPGLGKTGKLAEDDEDVQPGSVPPGTEQEPSCMLKEPPSLRAKLQQRGSAVEAQKDKSNAGSLALCQEAEENELAVPAYSVEQDSLPASAGGSTNASNKNPSSHKPKVATNPGHDPTLDEPEMGSGERILRASSSSPRSKIPQDESAYCSEPGPPTGKSHAGAMAPHQEAERFEPGPAPCSTEQGPSSASAGGSQPDDGPSSYEAEQVASRESITGAPSSPRSKLSQDGPGADAREAEPPSGKSHADEAPSGSDAAPVDEAENGLRGGTRTTRTPSSPWSKAPQEGSDAHPSEPGPPAGKSTEGALNSPQQGEEDDAPAGLPSFGLLEHHVLPASVASSRDSSSIFSDSDALRVPSWKTLEAANSTSDYSIPGSVLDSTAESSEDSMPDVPVSEWEQEISSTLSGIGNMDAMTSTDEPRRALGDIMASRSQLPSPLDGQPELQRGFQSARRSQRLSAAEIMEPNSRGTPGKPRSPEYDGVMPGSPASGTKQTTVASADRSRFQWKVRIKPSSSMPSLRRALSSPISESTTNYAKAVSPNSSSRRLPQTQPTSVDPVCWSGALLTFVSFAVALVDMAA